MGGIKKKKAKRGIEHHKRSLEETLEAPETYGVRVSEARCCDLHSQYYLHVLSIFSAQTKTRPAKRRKAAASAAADEAAENEEVAFVV